MSVSTAWSPSFDLVYTDAYNIRAGNVGIDGPLTSEGTNPMPPPRAKLVHWIRRRGSFALGVVATVAVVAGCTQSTDLEKAQARVTSKEAAVAEAQQTYDEARTAFCTDAGTYVAALDRYGKLFTDQRATVGDVTTLGADLDRPEEDVTTSAQGAVDAHADLVTAQQELAAARTDLESVKAGSSTTEAPSTTSTTTTLLPAASLDRITAAQTQLEATLASVNADTSLAVAGTQVNSAAFALEVAWLRVLDEAGCLTEDQAAQAHVALTGYTAALQTALKALGIYSGAVDGIYGPDTATAIASFQTSKGLPATGYVDVATATALEAALAAKGGAVAIQSVATTAALQSALKLAGYWSGPIDGNWTDALTAALASFQTALGVPASGVVDTATLEALRQAISDAKEPATTTTSPTTSTSTAPTTTSGGG